MRTKKRTQYTICFIEVEIFCCKIFFRTNSGDQIFILSWKIISTNPEIPQLVKKGFKNYLIQKTFFLWLQFFSTSKNNKNFIGFLLEKNFIKKTLLCEGYRFINKKKI